MQEDLDLAVRTNQLDVFLQQNVRLASPIDITPKKQEEDMDPHLLELMNETDLDEKELLERHLNEL